MENAVAAAEGLELVGLEGGVVVRDDDAWKSEASDGFSEMLQGCLCRLVVAYVHFEPFRMSADDEEEVLAIN